MSDRLAFRVPGVPVSQGSMKPTGRIGQRVRIVHSNAAALAQWRADVRHYALAELARQRSWCEDEPKEVVLDFYVHRPASAPKRIERPAKRPDLDKFIRAVLDAGTGLLWSDDARVVTILAHKWFADELGPRVDIQVRSL